MRVDAFDFDLPASQIAQQPRPRGDSRLLVVDRAAATWRDASIRDLPSILTPGDLLVVNDTKVFPARLLGRRDPSGGAVECLLLEREAEPGVWQALVHPGQKLKPGTKFIVEDPARAPGLAIQGEILDRLYFGRRRVRLSADDRTAPRDPRTPNPQDPGTLGPGDPLDLAVDRLGHVPLPPYIHRADTAADRERYQTIYARARGSIAAPTAGLHFDDALLASLDAAGIRRAAITLHVGYGTFKPVRVDEVEAHTVDPERYAVPPATADAIARAKAEGRRVIAVGTTTTRALEHAAARTGRVEAGVGQTSLFIRPGHTFRAIDGLLTNFHLPRSSLLMLVAAFAGHDLTMAAYRDAVARGFRFYSYGDAMVIL
ncbi:MAG: tRNA preQ1(34) S-adenosylmethionine ribosyltransferase-isomerase QueA [Vicinamibacterales bacterium]